MTPAAPVFSGQAMTRLLTAPYARGAEMLSIPLGNDDGAETKVSQYEFSEYVARYEVLPESPRYVLVVLVDIGPTATALEVDYLDATSSKVVDTKLVVIPARTPSGTSFVIPPPDRSIAAIRIGSLRQKSNALPGKWAANFALFALLGNIAKLAWVLGWEKDQLKRLFQQVREERLLPFANGFSLDLIGRDLRVPRFPPREYSFDRDTIALYHLNDPATGTISDISGDGVAPIVVTSASHGLSNGQQVTISGVNGNTNANGTFLIARIDENVFSLKATSGNGDYTFGGKWVLNDAVVDEHIRFNDEGHSGVIEGALAGAIGKFGSGFQFPGPALTGAIRIPHHSTFDLSETSSFTVELFFKTDSKGTSSTPRILACKGKLDASGNHSGAGWSLALATWHAGGVNNNLRWSVADNSGLSKSVFADIDLADGRFHHVAGVVDRNSKPIRLFVDGHEVLGEPADVDATLLGVVENAEDLRFGSESAASKFQFSGVLDEIRLSQVARTNFHPVLGEEDVSYRKRLGMFQRWFLPTPQNLKAAINSLVQIQGKSESFELIESFPPTSVATKTLRIVPERLLVGQAIDAEGRIVTINGDVLSLEVIAIEAEAAGTAQQDLDSLAIELLPVVLTKHKSDVAAYGIDPNNRLMQVSTASALDALINALVTKGIPGKLNILRSYAPAIAGLHSVGRALQLRHDSLALSDLAIMAHRVGFDFVWTTSSHVYASVAAGNKLGIAVEPVPSTNFDVLAGKTISLSLIPDTLPSTAQVQWTLIHRGEGRAHFEPHASDNPKLRTPINTRPRLQLFADAPGEVDVTVEVTIEVALQRKTRTISGTRSLRIGIDTLPDQASIAASGALSGSEELSVGKDTTQPNSIYLITSNIPGVDYGAVASNRKMLQSLEKPLKRLAALTEIVPGLRVVKAFDPAMTIGRHQAGRALILEHTAIVSGRLGALAHKAGFDFVRRDGNQIYCSVSEGELIEIVNASDGAPIADEITVGRPIAIRARLGASIATANQAGKTVTLSTATEHNIPVGAKVIVSGVSVAGFNGKNTIKAVPTPTSLQYDILNVGLTPGNGGMVVVGDFYWTLQSAGSGHGSLDFPQRPQLTLTPTAAGVALLQVTFLEPQPKTVAPYSFEIRLVASLDDPKTVIAKDQYDLIMNFLNYFHPIGVEVLTDHLRKHVVEIQRDQQLAFPAFTYPAFRT